MRQLEGGWLSNSAVERSKERLQRLPYVEKVEFENKPVAGSADLVDVDFKIKEGLPGQFGGGIGYSESQKFSLNGNFVHSNFMGTGDRIALEINAGKYSKSYTFAQTNPYTTIDGVSRTISFTYRDITQFVAASSAFSTKQMTVAVQWAYPDHRVPVPRIGTSVNKNTLVVSQGYSAQQSVDWVKENGNTFQSDLVDTNGDGVINSLDSPYTVYGTDFYTYELTGGWSYEGRNRALFADRGMKITLSARYALPLSDVRYYQSNFEFIKYVPLWKKLHAVGAGDGGLCRGAGQYHLLAAVPQLFRRRARQRPGLSREPLGTQGQHRHRQSLWRQFPGGQPLGADFPGARQVEERGADQLVLRHRQRFPDRQQG